MANIRIYRTYSYLEKNPVIDRCRTLVQDEGLFDRLGELAQISTISRQTLVKWFHGDTRNPQHATVAALITSLGYTEEFVKAGKTKLDIEAELKKAAAWLAKHPRKKARKRRST